MGVERAAWKFLGGRSVGKDGMGAAVQNKLGITAWDKGWTDGVRFPLRIPGQVSEDEWQAAIDELLAKRAGEVKRGTGTTVWLVEVIRKGGSDNHVFSTEELAEAFREKRTEPCVISAYEMDRPDLYYGEKQ